MRDVIDVRVSAAEYREMPEGGPRYQLIDGELRRMSPSPTSRHQLVSSRIFRRFDAHNEATRSGTILYAPLDVYLSAYDVVQPDIVFISSGRADRLVAHGIEGAPDLVVEVLSPSTRRLDLREKLHLYARTGVREAVYVDLDLDELTVVRFEGGAVASKSTLGRGETYETDILPGLRATVDDLVGPEPK